MEVELDKKQRPSEGRVEVEDGKLDFEELSDDTEVELILPRKGADERGPPGADIRDVPEASGTQQEVWSHMETLHGARPKWNRARRPSGVFEEPRGLEAEASGGKADQDVEVRRAPAPPLPLYQQNILKTEGVTPPMRDVQGHGVLRVPESRLPPRGTRVAPQISLGRLHVRLPKCLRFGGTTSWEQYRQVFDAIVLSNGWNEPTAALQLLSHLEGDALNVALLVPMSRRTSRTGLVDALSAHNGSPGRLADHRRQFEKTTRSAGEDPSIFAIALETLAVKAFGDMGQTARLRLIRDRFIAGHASCELRRYLDNVPPETPIRDVVDHCRVWESHADPEVRRVSKPGPDPIYPAYVINDSDKVVEEIRVAAGTKPTFTSDQMEELLRRLLVGVTTPVPVPTPVPEVPMVEKLLQLLVTDTQIRQPAPVAASEPVGLESLLRSLLSGQMAAAPQPRQGSFRRDWEGGS